MIVPLGSLALLAPQIDSALRPLGADGPDLGRYFVVCAVLVLLTGGLLLAFRKGLAATVRARAARRSLSVIDVLPLGGRQKILVVRCYDRTFLLGAGDKELAPIAELDPSVGAEAAARDAPAGPDRAAFAEALEKLRQSLPAPRLGAQLAERAASPAQPRVAEGALRSEPGAEIVPQAARPLQPTERRSRPEAGPAPGPAPATARPQEPVRPRLEGVVG